MKDAKPLTVKAEPCLTCPYRLDVPSGVWSASEYEKLRGYGANVTFNLFLCHQTIAGGVELACKGWLLVESESVAVRVACSLGLLDYPACFAPCSAGLHSSGAAAADYGQKQLKRPGRRALRVIEKLRQTGKFMEGEE